MTAPYSDFLAGKVQAPAVYGFTAHADQLPGFLFPFQRAVVTRALQQGRYALFEDCGLGKTGQELAWAQAVARHTGGTVLIFAPLAVAQQIVQEGEKFGIPVRYVRDEAAAAQATQDGVPLHVTNYERLDAFTVSAYAGVV